MGQRDCVHIKFIVVHYFNPKYKLQATIIFIHFWTNMIGQPQERKKSDIKFPAKPSQGLQAPHYIQACPRPTNSQGDSSYSG